MKEKELKDFNLKSNPFDLFTQASLELARACLFANSRLRNLDMYPPFSEFTTDTYQYLLDRMKENLEVLNTIPQNELEICRKNSFLSQNGMESSLNDKLFGIYQQLETEYSQCIPFLSDEMEKVLFGVDSDVYKNHKSLQEFYLAHKSDGLVSEKVLHNYLDYLGNDIQYCKDSFGWTEEEADAVENLEDTRKLSNDDAEYLLALIRTGFREDKDEDED